MDKLLEMKSKARSILARNAYWQSCQDGSYEMALSQCGYYQLLNEIKQLEKEHASN